MINITRATGQLKRIAPSEDAVICLVMSGVAVAGKIALGERKQLFSTDDLTALGITEVNNLLAYRDITDFYATAGEGAELNIMLVVDTTSLADICDITKDMAKKLLDECDGRGVVIGVNRKTPAGYVQVIANGLDADVNAAVTKAQALAVAYQAANIPFMAVLPALGWDVDTMAAMPARSTLNNDYVALNPWCNANDGIISMGQTLGWIAKHQVHQNIGRVASGKVSDTAFMPDGTPARELKYQWAAIAAKGMLVPVQISGKSGYFFLDDPALTAVTSDYSSISWNRTMIKAQRIAFAVLVERQNDDVDTDPSSGLIEGSLLSDWESDVETAIRKQMMAVSSTRKKEIDGVKLTIDPASDIVNDKVEAELQIVRKGQAKTINVRIGYATSI